MAKLKYTFKTDILFKMLFVKYPELLRVESHIKFPQIQLNPLMAEERNPG